VSAAINDIVAAFRKIAAANRAHFSRCGADIVHPAAVYEVGPLPRRSRGNHVPKLASHVDSAMGHIRFCASPLVLAAVVAAEDEGRGGGGDLFRKAADDVLIARDTRWIACGPISTKSLYMTSTALSCPSLVHDSSSGSPRLVRVRTSHSASVAAAAELKTRLLGADRRDLHSNACPSWQVNSVRMCRKSRNLG